MYGRGHASILLFPELAKVCTHSVPEGVCQSSGWVPTQSRTPALAPPLPAGPGWPRGQRSAAQVSQGSQRGLDVKAALTESLGAGDEMFLVPGTNLWTDQGPEE